MPNIHTKVATIVRTPKPSIPDTIIITSLGSIDGNSPGSTRNIQWLNNGLWGHKDITGVGGNDTMPRALKKNLWFFFTGANDRPNSSIQMWRSIDQGINWNQVSVPLGSHSWQDICIDAAGRLWAILFDPHEGGDYWHKSYVYYSDDSGANWIQSSASLQTGSSSSLLADRIKICAHPSDSNIIVTIAVHQQLSGNRIRVGYTTNRGTSWTFNGQTAINGSSVVNEIDICLTYTGRLIIGTVLTSATGNWVIYTTDDYAATAFITRKDFGSSLNNVAAIGLAHNTGGGAIYVLAFLNNSDPGQVYYSLDTGNTWSPFTNDLPGATAGALRSIALDEYSNTLYLYRNSAIGGKQQIWKLSPVAPAAQTANWTDLDEQSGFVGPAEPYQNGIHIVSIPRT